MDGTRIDTGRIVLRRGESVYFGGITAMERGTQLGVTVWILREGKGDYSRTEERLILNKVQTTRAVCPIFLIFCKRMVDEIFFHSMCFQSKHTS